MSKVTQIEQDGFNSDFQLLIQNSDPELQALHGGKKVEFINDICWPIVDVRVLASLNPKQIDEVNSMLVKLSNGRYK